MQVAKNDIVNSNDCIQDFIDKCLITDDNGRIGKQEMRDAYVAMYPDKKISVLQMISALKDKGIEYKCDLRFNHVKGCFVGLSFKEEETSNALNYSGCSEKDKRAMLTEIEQLKKELADFKRLQKLNKRSYVVQSTVTKKMFKSKEFVSKKGKMDDHISSLDDLFMKSLF